MADSKNERNDPCYCGSGLKYKKCCLEKKQFVKNHPDLKMIRNELDLTNFKMSPELKKQIASLVHKYRDDITAGSYELAYYHLYSQEPPKDDSHISITCDFMNLKPGLPIILSNETDYHYAIYLGDDLYLSKWGSGHTPIAVAKLVTMEKFYGTDKKAVVVGFEKDTSV